MICDIATPVGGVKLDIHLRKQLIGCEQMFSSAITSKRDHVRVLEEQQHVWKHAHFARLNDPLLDFARPVIRHKAKLYFPADFFFLVHVRFGVKLDTRY